MSSALSAKITILAYTSSFLISRYFLLSCLLRNVTNVDIFSLSNNKLDFIKEASKTSIAKINVFLFALSFLIAL